MYKKIIKYWCWVIFVLSCKPETYKPIEFPVTENLKAELILVNEILQPTFVTFHKAGFFFVANYNTEEKVHVYTLPDLKHYTSFGQKGQGPDDFQAFPMFCNSMSESLYIWGYNAISIRRFVCDSIIRTVEEFRLANYEAYNQMHIVKDSILIYNLSDDLIIKKIKLKDGKEIDRIELKKDDHNEPYYYSNNGILAANDQYIAYAYRYKKQIDIYDIATMKLTTRLIGEYKFKMPEVNGSNKIYYINIVAGKNYFYALTAVDDNKYMDSNNTTINRALEVYDYDGNPVVKYSFDISPLLFIVDEENNHIYGYDGKYEDYFLKYGTSGLQTSSVSCCSNPYTP
jgi:hypothetical protein